jgi:hypothetical protein|tara:strand:- start:41 stop:235 length:195 start_codon:yes stop_codon:yes gene_type:complete
MPDWIVYLFLFALPILAIVGVSVFFVGYLVVSLTVLTIRLIVFVIRLPPRLLIRLSRSAAAVFR